MNDPFNIYFCYYFDPAKDQETAHHGGLTLGSSDVAFANWLFAGGDEEYRDNLGLL